MPCFQYWTVHFVKPDKRKTSHTKRLVSIDKSSIEPQFYRDHQKCKFVVLNQTWCQFLSSNVKLQEFKREEEGIRRSLMEWVRTGTRSRGVSCHLGWRRWGSGRRQQLVRLVDWHPSPELPTTCTSLAASARRCIDRLAAAEETCLRN
jgi:hypothetical protein